MTKVIQMECADCGWWGTVAQGDVWCRECGNTTNQAGITKVLDTKDLQKFKEAYNMMISHTEIDRERMDKAKDIDEVFSIFSELSHYLKQVFIEHLANVYKDKNK